MFVKHRKMKVFKLVELWKLWCLNDVVMLKLD